MNIYGIILNVFIIHNNNGYFDILQKPITFVKQRLMTNYETTIKKKAFFIKNLDIATKQIEIFNSRDSRIHCEKYKVYKPGHAKDLTWPVMCKWDVIKRAQNLKYF